MATQLKTIKWTWLTTRVYTSTCKSRENSSQLHQRPPPIFKTKGRHKPSLPCPSHCPHYILKVCDGVADLWPGNKHPASQWLCLSKRGSPDSLKIQKRSSQGNCSPLFDHMDPESLVPFSQEVSSLPPFLPSSLFSWREGTMLANNGPLEYSSLLLGPYQYGKEPPCL